MLVKNYFSLSVVVFLSLCLLACGSGDSSSTNSSPTLNLNAAERAYVTGGFATNGVISGYCQGTKVQNFSATYSGVTYAGLPALIADETETDYLAPNPPAFCSAFYNSNDGGQTQKIFWDPTIVQLITDGSNPPNYVYSNLQAFPTSVTAASKGTAATYVNYMNTTSPITTGALTWSMAADTPNSLLWITVDTATLISTGELAYTSTTTYRISSNNTVTALYKTIRAFSGFTRGAGDLTINETYQ